jgi:hypothetical protein
VPLKIDISFYQTTKFSNMNREFEKIALEKFESQEIENLNHTCGGVVEVASKITTVCYTECDDNYENCQDKVKTVFRDPC